MRKGSKMSPESREKMRQAKLKNPTRYWLGKHLPEEVILRLRVIHKGKHVGEKNGMWIADRSKIVTRQQRNDSAYYSWRQQIWLRDGFKCKIANPDCNGRIEAHHILGWAAYPELRYKVNNGITLCHAHHPRKRKDERRMEAAFQQIVANMPTNAV